MDSTSIRTKVLKWVSWGLEGGWIEVGLVALLICCTIVAACVPQAWDDYHIFRYIGWRITQGDLLFTDIWDHKSPLIFWMNALACWCTPTTFFALDILPWILWGLSFFLLRSTFVTFLELRWARWSAVLCVLSGCSYKLGTAPNTIEGLVFFFDAIGLYIWSRQGDYRLKTFLMGAIVGVGGLCKANLLGFGVFLAVVGGGYGYKALRHFLWTGVYAFFGMILVIGLAMLPFVCNETLGDLIDAAWTFNCIEYQNGRVGLPRVVELVSNLFTQWYTPIPWIPLGYWLIGCFVGVALVCIGRNTNTPVRRILRLALALWYFVEIGLVLLSGTVYTHYLILSNLPLFILIGILLQEGQSRVKGVTLSVVVLLLLFFVGKIVKGNTEKMLYASEQRSALSIAEIKNRPVATCGFLSVAKMMLYNRAYTHQKYAFHYRTVKTKQRVARAQEDLIQMLVSPETAAFLVEGNRIQLDSDAEQNLRLKKALARWRYSRTIRTPYDSVDLYLPAKPAD